MFGRTRLTNVREKLLGIVTECWEVGELTAREFETAKRLINVGEGEEGINALNNVDDPRLVERLQMERKLEYLLAEPRMPRKTIATALGKALACSTGRGLRGHGYGAEQGVLSTLKLFKTGGLREFLVKGQHICPEFHALVWDIFDEREAMLAAEGGGRIEGPWGADYTEEWLELLGETRPDKRIYLAYGSNMSSEQMRERCPEAELIGSTYLENWSLAFYEYATIEEKEGAKTPVVIW